MDDDGEMVDCIRIGDDYYFPVLTWMKYNFPKEPKRYHNEDWTPFNGPMWSEADSDDSIVPDGAQEVVKQDYVLSLESYSGGSSSSSDAS